MAVASGSIAYLGAARFQGFWNARTNEATGSGLDDAAPLGYYTDLLIGTGTLSGGYHGDLKRQADGAGSLSAYTLTLRAGDYWQVTESFTRSTSEDINAQGPYRLNDWIIYSSSAGSSTGTWKRLPFEDTIASIVMGDLAGSTVFNLTGSSDKQVLFMTGASDADVIQSGSNNFVYDYTNDRVGIGTATPQRQLHIENTDTRVLLKSTATNSNCQIRFETTALETTIGANIKTHGSQFEIVDTTNNVARLTMDSSGNVGIGVSDPDELLEVAGDLKVSGANRLYLYDSGGEYLSSDGTDLTIASGAKINLTATTDVVIPVNVGLHFGDGNEKIESDNTDLTINSGVDINLTATTDVNIPANVGLTFGDDGEKIEGDGTDLTIASSNDLNLTATTDINVPANVGLTFGDDGEKIEGDGTDLTIASSNDLNLTATTDINVPANVGLTFGDDGEKIEGDGTNLTIASSGTMTLDGTGAVTVDSDAALTLGGASLDIDADGGAIDIDATGQVSIDSSAGSLTLGAALANGQTLKLGPNGAVEMVFTPHGTPANEKWSLTNTAGTASDAIALIASAGGITLTGDTDHGVLVGTLSGGPVSIGHTTSETTVNDNLTVTGTTALNDDITVAAGKKIYFDSTDTYIYSNSDDPEDLVIGADADIILEPDGNVGIGTTTPSYDLHISDDTRAQVAISTHHDSVATELRFERSRGTAASPTVVADDDLLGKITWYGYNDDGSALDEAVFIKGEVDGTPSSSTDDSDMPGRILFGTTTDGAGNCAERMRIDSSGNVGIGTTADASAILHLSSTTKGFLPPKLTTTQRNSVSSPAEGLIIYNDTTNAINVYDGSSWAAVGGTTINNATENELVTVASTTSELDAEASLTFDGSTLNATGSVNVAGAVSAMAISNKATITAAATIPTDYNSLMLGPITISGSVALTVQDGAVLKIKDISAI